MTGYQLRRWLLLFLLVAVARATVDPKKKPAPAATASEDNVVTADTPDALDEPDEAADDQPKVTPVEEVEYRSPQLDHTRFHLYEHFDARPQFEKNWIKSRATKAESEDMQFDGEWGLSDSHPSIKGDGALLMLSKARHHAIGAKLNQPFQFSHEKQLILQYEVQFRNGQECGGAYVKLLAAPSGPLEQINDRTPYSIMFGPDKCGNDYKVHFIFMHRNPKNGTLREIHWKRATSVTKLEEAVKDGKWHLLRLLLRADNTFEVLFDKKSVGKGSLLEEFNPSVNPEAEIDDPNDSKPEDWDEREKIPDPDSRKPEEWDENEPRKIADPIAVKPSDWDENEPEMVPDPEASKPADWDTDMDGEWEPPLINNPRCKAISGCGPWKAPLIDNPKYRGKWKPPMIANPNYKGKWAPRKIPNPDYFEDKNPFSRLYAIDAAAFELWTISDSIAFDNVLITNDEALADHVVDLTYQIKKDLADTESSSLLMRLLKYTNKNPWMWAVWLVGIALPVVLFINFCCLTPIQSKQAVSEQARRKKTDEPTADDPVEERPTSGPAATPTTTTSRLSRERSAPRYHRVVEEEPAAEATEAVAGQTDEDEEPPKDSEVEESHEEESNVEEEEEQADEEEPDENQRQTDEDN